MKDCRGLVPVYPRMGDHLVDPTAEMLIIAPMSFLYSLDQVELATLSRLVSGSHRARHEHPPRVTRGSRSYSYYDTCEVYLVPYSSSILGFNPSSSIPFLSLQRKHRHHITIHLLDRTFSVLKLALIVACCLTAGLCREPLLSRACPACPSASHQLLPTSSAFTPPLPPRRDQCDSESDFLLDRKESCQNLQSA